MSVRFAGALIGAATLGLASLGLAASARAQPGLATRSAEGLGLIGPEIPDELKQAQADPYAPPADPACTTVPAEIAKLDALLGPDINQPKPRTFIPTDVVGHAVRSAIPYRSAIRFVTGADRREKEKTQAEKAGWARRGFLKGLAARLDCPSPTQAADAAPPRIELPPVLTPASSAAPVLIEAPPAETGAAATVVAAAQAAAPQ